MGAPSKSDNTVVLKKLKYSSASEKITEPSVNSPSRFLKKKMSLIVLPTKDGLGFVSSSPTSRLVHVATSTAYEVIVLPVKVGTIWIGKVVLSSVV